MRALLDVNVLIALLDANHSLHRRATDWLLSEAAGGWATCPITQNGCIRIMSHPGYPNVQSVHAIIGRLMEAASSSYHQFWPDDVSLLDEQVAYSDRIHGPKQLTDIYLLALAVHHGGRFVTFDARVAMNGVCRASENNLVVL